MKKNNPKSSIAFTSDILREVVEDTGVDLKNVEAVYSSMMKYIQFLTKRTECVALFIPSLGTLHVRFKYVLDKVKSLKNKEGNNKTKFEVFDGKRQIISDHITEVVAHAKKKKSFVSKSRHCQRDKLKLSLYSGDMNLEEIETKQNNR